MLKDVEKHLLYTLNILFNRIYRRMLQ